MTNEQSRAGSAASNFTQDEMSLLVFLRENAGTRFYLPRLAAFTKVSKANAKRALAVLVRLGMVNMGVGSEPPYWCNPIRLEPPKQKGYSR